MFSDIRHGDFYWLKFPELLLENLKNSWHVKGRKIGPLFYRNSLVIFIVGKGLLGGTANVGTKNPRRNSFSGRWKKGEDLSNCLNLKKYSSP